MGFCINSSRRQHAPDVSAFSEQAIVQGYSERRDRGWIRSRSIGTTVPEAVERITEIIVAPCSLIENIR